MPDSLLPCPFCGAGTTLIKENGRIWTGQKYGEPSSVSVQHWCDPVEGQPSRMVERVGRDYASAIAAWNRRALSAPAAGEPELPEPDLGTIRVGREDVSLGWSPEAIRAYGQAMAEHARRVALEDHQPSITWVDDMGCTHTMSAEKAASELKALFDAWPDGLNEIEAAIEGWRRAAPPQGEQT